MSTTISSSTRRELLTARQDRYRPATRDQKSRILDEYVAVARCHRKHAVRLLTTPPSPEPSAETPARGTRIYVEAVRAAVIVLWEAADRICGKRLKCLIPNLLDALERHGHLSLDETVRELVLRASPATLDRLLATARNRSPRRKKRKAATKPSRATPIRTFADWDHPAPGFLEMDFVSHGGTSMHGVFLWSLVATDVASGWTEMVPLVAREQSLVVEGLKTLRRQFPLPVLGIDTDNDSAFINETLRAYCVEEGLVFTRSRAYQKNDQAWIEQKNGAVIRRFVGYERFAGLIAGPCLARLYESVRRYVNVFQPSFQLKSKVRIGAKVRKSYHPPATPCDRLLAHASVLEPVKESLRMSRGSLDPLALLHRIREGQSALAGMRSGEFGSGTDRQSLDEFLASLPDLWREGEVRPTHRSATSAPRSYRTRKDPFEGVWAEILGWLRKEPDATAKVLMDRLQEQFPGRFPDGQLRTLQRRIRDWRRVMATTLVGHGLGSGPAAEVEVIRAGQAE